MHDKTRRRALDFYRKRYGGNVGVEKRIALPVLCSGDGKITARLNHGHTFMRNFMTESGVTNIFAMRCTFATVEFH